MTSNDGTVRSTPLGEDDNTFPQSPRAAGGPPSIISSRMTDIESNDGGDSDVHNYSTTSPKRSGLPSDVVSQSLRRGLSGAKRSSGVASISGSISRRPGSTSSRSHVPSLTSHAFFHPMSSQKLQAQRQSSISTPALAQQLSSDDEARSPASRGSEVTEQETLDRITPNTNPTQGHYPSASLSDSVRPLQKKTAESKGLSVNIDKSYKNSGNLPTPNKSPHSLRSSFLLPGKSNQGENGSNRSMPGGEKLESVASSPRPTPTTAAAPQTKKKLTKPAQGSLGNNFEYFEGNTVFCLGGRLQNSRDRPVNIATGFSVVLPAVLFFIFSASWLWHNISPAIPLIFTYVFYICISSFLHASGSDPGILPRNLHKNPPNENEDPLRLAPPSTEWTLIKSAKSSTAAMEVPTKYCKTCKIWRPPRAHHCRLCDNCIETADHHCVWINNCVGRRNYRYFVTFLASGAIGAAYLVGACLAQILVYRKRESVSVGHAINHFRVPFAIAIYGVLAFLYPAALTGYHFFLMARGETTREFLNSRKFLKKDRYRPFTQGNWVKNWIVVLCRPKPPTYYRFKKGYVQGDQRLGIRRVQLKTDSKNGQQGMEMQDVSPAQRKFQGPVSLHNPAHPSA